MKLLEALGIESGDMVTFIGAGGKTTAMFRLARESLRKEKVVIVTTTTKILKSEGKKADCLILSSNLNDMKNQVSRAVGTYEIVAIASGVVEGKKLSGLEPGWIDELSEINDLGMIIVEGDGAFHKSLKAPADYEPVIPPSTNTVAHVLGIDVIGKPLNSKNVHRPEIVSSLTGFETGDSITPELAARIISHKEGGLKNVPSGARVVPLINKVENEEDEENATVLSEKILGLSGKVIGKVAIGNVQSENPVIKLIERN
ncbi:hypothetical protein AKJ54_00515 [candidate division MSBL1 archaeon SCGC-AAA382K21]|uniref:Selenium-dependent hydroxylase accessory protein YqeC n=1 Tax=candidate division MSBL1 archaeon SCGC-AAA382K21 TaxID=1698283 RepID=A0A133VL95_9EURY|nr:hypothetical protein AKJ54_00515 [candidate division MSBL1 archaeon SCGC-AAA382K21]